MTAQTTETWEGNERIQAEWCGESQELSVRETQKGEMKGRVKG